MYLNSSTNNHGCTAILMLRITDNERGTETAVASLPYHLHTGWDGWYREETNHCSHFSCYSISDCFIISIPSPSPITVFPLHAPQLDKHARVCPWQIMKNILDPQLATGDSNKGNILHRMDAIIPAVPVTGTHLHDRRISGKAVLLFPSWTQKGHPSCLWNQKRPCTAYPCNQ